MWAFDDFPNPWKFTVFVFVHKQSKDIDAGVTTALEARNGSEERYSSLGAGDQGTVYGYATNETREMLPLPLVLAHRICKRVDTVRKDKIVKGILPDGKSQVTVEYEDGRPKRVKTIVVSVQHDKDKTQEQLYSDIKQNVLWQCFEDFPFDDDTEIFINPSGRFVEGGPAADTGLTGRKMMVDTYGGLALHGGGAFSGKDPTKVDRSGAYMARYIAKNIAWSDLAERCEVALSYAIGKADPVAVDIDAFGTSTLTNSYFINANSATAPGIVDADRNPILTRSEVYSGVYGRASISFYAFNSNGNKGIACGLNNLQKVRDGEPLGGKVSAESDFATDDDDEFLN